MGKLATFYDRYHLKNDRFFRVIKPGNFTYFYTFEFLQEPYLQKRLRSGKLLDVGCGVGALSLYFASLGAKVTGIDISPRAISLAVQAAQAIGLKNVTFTVGQLKPGQGSFDMAFCSEVIEHIADDTLFLKHLRSQVKPGGYLFLSTPSTETWLYKRGYYRQFDKEVGHLRRYTEQTLRAKLEKAGWEVVKMRSVEGPLRNILFTSKLGWLIKFIKGPLVSVFHLFDRVSSWLFGSADIQVLARRPQRLA